MRYLIPQIIFTALLASCLKVEKKNQNESDTTTEVLVYSQSEFILNETMTLTEDTIINADRIYLTKNAVIYTKKFNLKINAQTLESELGATITHYGYDQTAPVNQHGQDGGHIEIKSITASGHLELVASSEKGGAGLGGWGPTEFKVHVEREIETCTAGSGKDTGKIGTIQFEATNSQNLKLARHVFRNPGGDIGPVAENYRVISYFNVLNPNYKGRDQNCSEISTIGKSAYSGQVCIKLQNQNNFECTN